MTNTKNTRRRKVLLTISVLCVLVGLIALGSFAAFTATTTNTGNNISSGTVAINQHTGATTLYNVTNQKPGQSTQKCVRVTYTGSLQANVELYVSSGITSGSLYNIQVERGSGLTTLDGTMSCAGFTATSTATPANTTLGTFPTSYATGLDGKPAPNTWNTNDSVDYRFTITQNDDTAANAHTSVASSGPHTFTWEAQNN
jgi:predicted ribosomally synthesized peptide with SipW-like signal peptide